MRIPETVINEIHNRLDIAQVVGEYVRLERKGSRYWGLCPFHNEKTPSFTVTPEKGAFYCFGCQHGGGLFQFVQDIEKVTFVEAVQLLAKKAGVELALEESSIEGTDRDAFLELYRRVAGSFHYILTRTPQAEMARVYLERRAIQPAILDSFMLGYAPPERDWLCRFLRQKQYTDDFLKRSGLLVERDGKLMGFFANRIMFPIANQRGEILAFGGRTLADAPPKYLNSPETAIFRKGENLFGLDKAIPALKEKGACTIVEGYMDCLAMHQAGITNTVAPLGTALTEYQIRTLKRYASKAVLVFDGDPAGMKAAVRALSMLEQTGVDASVAALPPESDPADILQKEGSEGLRGSVSSPVGGFQYLVRYALAQNDNATPEGKAKIYAFVHPYLSSIRSQVKRDACFPMLADALGVHADAVREDYARMASSGALRPAAPVAKSDPVRADLFLVIAVSANRQLYPLVRNAGLTPDDFEDPRAREVAIALEDSFRGGDESLEGLLSRIENEEVKKKLLEKIASEEFSTNQEQLVRDTIRKLRKASIEGRRARVSSELGRADGRDALRTRELLEEKMYLDEELKKLRMA